MADMESRISRLEERVYVSHTDEMKELKADIKTLVGKLNYLILALVAMFGVQFLKLLHGG